LPRRILDINVQDYNNTAKLNKELFGYERLAEDINKDNVYSDSKNDRDFAHSTV